MGSNEIIDQSQAWRERVERIAADPELARDYVESLQKRLKGARDHLERVIRETSIFTDVDRTEAQVRIDQLEAELFAIEDAQWTKEVTVARRQAWNEAVRNPKYRAGGVVFSSSIERDLGFSFETLKRQVKRWEL